MLNQIIKQSTNASMLVGGGTVATGLFGLPPGAAGEFGQLIAGLAAVGGLLLAISGKIYQHYKNKKK